MIPTLTGKLIRDRGASFRETMENSLEKQMAEKRNIE